MTLPVLLLLAQAGAGYEYYLAGSGDDAIGAPVPGYLLAGGGKDVDDAFRWLLERSRGGDVVVLRASGGDAYNPYLYRLGKVDSVETLVIKDRQAASDPFVVSRVRKAEALFIAGGDQWNYVRLWKGTPLMAAIQGLIERGAPVGGTSAGLAVLGQYAFSAQFDTITSKEAMADPKDKRITIEKDFLRIGVLQGILTDSHFAQRDRMGRLIVFLGRIGGGAKGIGIDERTALLVEPGGEASVRGENGVYFLENLGAAEMAVFRLDARGRFNVRTWQGDAGDPYVVSRDRAGFQSRYR